MDEWIDVNDEAPKENGDYLCYIRGFIPHLAKERWMEVCFYNGQHFYDGFGDLELSVTHWRRLPSPPREKCRIEQKKCA